jgi:hypothetical protein
MRTPVHRRAPKSAANLVNDCWCSAASSAGCLIAQHPVRGHDEKVGVR